MIVPRPFVRGLKRSLKGNANMDLCAVMLTGTSRITPDSQQVPVKSD